MLRLLLITIGFVSVGLGGLGVLVPGLPTTPFLLLAAACFAKSSDRFYNWLIANRVFGPVIRNWRETRSMTRKSKVIAISSVAIFGLSSIVFFIDDTVLRVIVFILLMLPATILLKIRTTESLPLAKVESES